MRYFQKAVIKSFFKAITKTLTVIKSFIKGRRENKTCLID